MPIYEYSCDSCEKRHEVMKKITDESPAECPDCGTEMRKLVSSTSFVLKGTGWYATDYAGDKAKTNSGASSGGSETKSETKKAPAAESAPEKKETATAS